MCTHYRSSLPLRAAKVLREAQYPDTWPYTEEDFSRIDESNDQLFYSQPRLVYHIDEFAIRALTKFYKNNFVPGADILDV